MRRPRLRSLLPWAEISGEFYIICSIIGKFFGGFVRVMVKSANNGSGSVPPFLKKCYEMVDDESTDSLISWSKTSDSFVIWDMTEFSVRLLPKYFKHNNSSSFVRQLNIYVGVFFRLPLSRYLCLRCLSRRLSDCSVLFIT